jgi:hypothetical protein
MTVDHLVEVSPGSFGLGLKRSDGDPPNRFTMTANLQSSSLP